tara:strand:- start:3132 stop:3893 length:762 start_codon:yes stop_codon:yes gene_type:complete
MTQIDLEDWLTSSQGDTPASLSRQPGSAEAIKMTDISGRKCLGLSKLCGPAGSLEKMLLATSLWASTRCYLTWKAQATPAGATLYRLSPQMPRTDETAAGLLHTPTAQANQMAPSMRDRDAGSWGKPRIMIPTPTASDHIERNSTSSEAVNPLTGKSVSLDRFVKFWPDEETQRSGEPQMWATPSAADSVKMWPTPTANEDAAGTPNGKMQRQLGNHPDIRGNTPEEWQRGSLNPEFVEYLMGYPVGYTDLDS